MAVINSPFESQYGFKGPGFSVDNLGNIVATSIITVTSESSDIVDYRSTVHIHTAQYFHNQNPLVV